ncbi:MAG: toxin-antitoxin system protein [Myxococcales bacterium]|nr:MAG: toxin-antitoxin system protein [Myxococcales bacterium]
MPGATVRISETARDLLRDLARRTNATMQDVIEKALAEYRQRLFWEQARRDFQAMRDDPELWNAEVAERERWDATLKDGLDEGDAP